MSLARFMIAAPASGSGKTTVTCGILQALVNRGMKVSSFKCGPDYIDPMFHARVIGTKSRNMDSYFCDDETLRYLFCRTAEDSDISVIEGVMGFYDGIRAADTVGSSYEVSQKLEAPVVLLVNCKGASISVVPVVKGFKEYRENRIAGVILNNMSASIFPEVKAAVEKETGVRVVGYVPKLKDLVLESRHLGLVLPDEVASLKENLNRLAGILEDTLDIDALVELASGAPPISGKAPVHGTLPEKVRIGLAYDDTFCFTYEDNIALLEECGAEIVPFSPMRDARLPDGIHGIILSGGYPELHGEVLSGNASMLEDMREKISSGMPCLAECGGFMYLHERMEDADGRIWPLVGVIKGEVRNTGKLSRFGYVTLSSQDGDSILAGGGCKGHEFHYWDSSDCGTSWEAVKTSGRKYACGHEEGNLAAGFPHLYYYSNPDVPYRFLLKCRDYEA
ncbi:cobyrinate a,c-diamide synthase [Methanomethylophilus alvi]|uniref:cobyrinate a,c-diamide synthase n=1 Tax=Methanomethylophilus alvi TaxID=1291540 RepID=UPI0037DD5B00